MARPNKQESDREVQVETKLAAKREARRTKKAEPTWTNYPNIAKAAREIMSDNRLHELAGGEQAFMDAATAILPYFKVKDLKAFDKWLGTLTEDELREVCSGEYSEAEELKERLNCPRPANSEDDMANLVLNAIFDCEFLPEDDGGPVPSCGGGVPPQRINPPSKAEQDAVRELLVIYGCNDLQQWQDGEWPDQRQLTCSACGAWRPLLDVPGPEPLQFCAPCCRDLGILSVSPPQDLHRDSPIVRRGKMAREKIKAGSRIILPPFAETDQPEQRATVLEVQKTYKNGDKVVCCEIKWEDLAQPADPNDDCIRELVLDCEVYGTW
jgi:hypothetical protein